MVLPSSSQSWIAGDSNMDTAFQILKAAASIEISVGNDVAAGIMSEWTRFWVSSLEETDHRRKYAWPHAEDNGVNSFRLDDHIWIWRALKSLDIGHRQAWKLMSKKHLQKSPWTSRLRAKVKAGIQVWLKLLTVHSTALVKDDIARLRKTFASELVQREVAQRFTTENDLLAKRMFMPVVIVWNRRWP